MGPHIFKAQLTNTIQFRKEINMNNEIEKIARKICFKSGTWETCEECLEYHNITRCYCHDYVKIFIDAGYHKTVWHKVDDGDLPKQENGDVIAMPVQACYKNKIGIKCNGPCYFFFIDNSFRALNSNVALDVIAWTELPVYEENIDEGR